MKCHTCDGNGRFEVEDNGVVMQGVYWRCPNCCGKGIVEPLTNDEWRRTCSAKEFAEFLNNTIYDAWFAGRENETPKIKGIRKWDSWLKEKHE